MFQIFPSTQTEQNLGHFTPKITATRSHQWDHSLGEIISALIRAGLVIDVVEETSHTAWRPWPELMIKDEHGYRLRQAPERLPLQFVISAHKM